MHLDSIHLPVPSYPPSALAVFPQNKIKRRKKKERKISTWKLWCGTVSCTVDPLAHITLLAGVHCKESLVWFEAPGFCYTVDTGSSPGPLLGILMLPCVVEILQF